MDARVATRGDGVLKSVRIDRLRCVHVDAIREYADQLATKGRRDLEDDVRDFTLLPAAVRCVELGMCSCCELGISVSQRLAVDLVHAAPHAVALVSGECRDGTG